MVKKAEKAADQNKKSISKLGCAFWILLLILAGGAAFYYFGGETRDELLSSLMDQPKPGANPLKVEPAEGMDKSGEAAKTKPPKLKVKPMQGKANSKGSQETDSSEAPESRGGKGYYVSLGRCIYPECLTRLKREANAAGAPVYSKKVREQVIMWELISAGNFSEELAWDKMRTLEKYNKMAVQASLKPVGKRFRVTFGSFPIKDRAEQMSSYLAQMYPQVNLRFVIETRKEKVEYTKVYSGPYANQAKARRMYDLLRQNPAFTDLRLVKQP